MNPCVGPVPRAKTGPAILPRHENSGPYDYGRLPRRLFGRAAQLWRGLHLHGLGLGRLGLGWFGLGWFGLGRLDPGALDPRRFDPGGDFGARCGDGASLIDLTRMRPCDGSRHQHLGGALMMEVAIREAHAGDRAAEAALVRPVEIEAGLERQAAQRGAHGLSANLQRVARQPDMPDRTGARELHGAGSAHVIEDTPGTAGAVEA